MELTLELYPSLERYLAASRTDCVTEFTDEPWLLIEDLFPWEGPTRLGATRRTTPVGWQDRLFGRHGRRRIGPCKKKGGNALVPPSAARRPRSCCSSMVVKERP
ncbi:hypothetical protein Pla110_24510 [Polystyrenella longa]|uniref:Uncharacterized protein n=1 Tax=Polystyrenella longa TaxID=2528007 RepID=A0A518CND0_9PLAN|nr:hypothetical protein Pla110_24510 [Polystyrenella longa]